MGSASLPRALSLVQISSSSVPEKRLYLPASITISARSINSLRNNRDYDLKQIEDVPEILKMDFGRKRLRSILDQNSRPVWFSCD